MGAGLAIAAALTLEFAPHATVSHPFTEEPTSPGQPPTVEWREVPAGLLPPPDLEGAVAARALPAGVPLLPTDLTVGAVIPSGWWTVGIELPAEAAPGTPVQIVLPQQATVPGLVVQMREADWASGSSPVALVAVPGEQVAAVAAAGSDAIAVLAPPS